MNVVKNFPKTSSFKWTPERSQAAILLAEGYTYQEVADEIGKTKRTITAWMGEIEFSAEVDRLSLMCGIASRAERLRLIKRVIRQQAGDKVTTDKDVLDWLKFAQSETDGVKLDLAALFAAVSPDDTSVASAGPGSDSKQKKG
jgi:transposase-like protein